MTFYSLVVLGVWTKNQAADVLSGLPTNGCDRIIYEDNILEMAVFWSEKQALKSTGADANDHCHAKLASTLHISSSHNDQNPTTIRSSNI